MNKSFSKIILLSTLVLSLLFFNSCRKLAEIRSTEHIVEKPTKTVIKQVSENNIDYDWLNTRVRFRFQFGGDIQSASAQIRMKKDSIIWASISPALGIEIARVQITPDSIHILNRLDRTYMVRPFKFVQNYLRIDTISFQGLQDLLASNPIYPIHQDSESIVDSAFYKLKYEAPHYIQTHHIDPISFRPLYFSYSKPAVHQNMELTYSEFEVVEGQHFPHNISMNVKLPETVRLDLNYSRVSFEKPRELNFNIPESYEKY